MVLVNGTAVVGITKPQISEYPYADASPSTE